MIAGAGARFLAVAMLAVGARAVAADLPASEQPSDDAVPAGDEAAFPDARFGPRYVIEDVVVRGNRKTSRSLIVEELATLGLAPGANVDASDARVETARYRLLSLGYFLDVRLSVARGAKRGGVVLEVEVEERGTLVINELFPATSQATLFWGGADLSETNFLGRGINLGAGFVVSTKPVVPDAHAGLGLRLHVGLPTLGGPNGLHLSLTGLYNDGSEFYRASGDDRDADPGRFVATRVHRAGGLLTAGKMLPAGLHAAVSFREEEISATLPPQQARTLPGGGVSPIDFLVRDGASHLDTLAAGLDLDTRSDPILPRAGMRIALHVEGSTHLLGSSYDYVKTVLEGSFYWRMPHGHALGLHVFAGAIAGDAPYFDRFFIGDLNLLLPRRALGIDFSTQPSPNLLDSNIAHHRYDNYAGRLLVEYAIPIWRRRGLVYGGDAFVAAGLLGMASDGDFLAPGPFSLRSLPIDLTGDLGLRLDTYVGVFTISIANALSRSSF
ncbi:MAG TPA: BamA/TamA family outer membrane protein [Polyangia bacterium]|nr:BamA/TamA family outer membrane protein [Polyangia bacterium]